MYTRLTVILNNIKYFLDNLIKQVKTRNIQIIEYSLFLHIKEILKSESTKVLDKFFLFS
jgi:hypothetical protein